MTTKQERIAKRRADMPKQYRKLYDRVVVGKASPRNAIKMQCLECWAYVRLETQTCDNYACPLYAYRPYQNPAKSPTEPLGQAQD
jgi:hypothetical protein